MLNTSYLTDSYIVFTLKMESLSKNTIFGLKMMVKSGLEKIFWKFHHAGNYFSLLHKCEDFYLTHYKFSNKNQIPPPRWDFKNIFSRPLFTIILGPKIVILGIDSSLRVKTIIMCDVPNQRPSCLIIWFHSRGYFLEIVAIIF